MKPQEVGAILDLPVREVVIWGYALPVWQIGNEYVSEKFLAQLKTEEEVTSFWKRRSDSLSKTVS